MQKIVVTENQLNQTIKFLKKEPRLTEIYENTRNNSAIIPITETNAKRLIDRHTKNGFAIISACRGYDDFNLNCNNPQDVIKHTQINIQRTKEMISIIKSRGFSYTLSYGGFIENQGSDAEENVYERSCIIYAEKKDGSIDSDGMYKLAIDLCRKYNQDSVLIKMPNDCPKYITQDGKVDMEFGDNVSFNDLTQTYFTDLHKNTQKKMSDKSKPTRFSFMESFISPKPQCYSESHIRHLNGEIFLT